MKENKYNEEEQYFYNEREYLVEDDEKFEGFYRNDLVDKITNDFMEKARLRIQVIMYTVDPSQFDMINKEFYCEELIQLVKAHTLRYLKTVVMNTQMIDMDHNGKTKQQAEKEMQEYINNSVKMLGIIRNELQAKNQKSL